MPFQKTLTLIKRMYLIIQIFYLQTVYLNQITNQKTSNLLILQ